MIKIDEKLVSLSNNGASVRIPKVFFDDHKMAENKEIEIHRDTLEDGRDCLIIIPKSQLVSSSQPAHQTA